MALPDFSMRQLLEAGVHFGHQTHRWNPKMSRYIFGARNNIHIIDLSQTVPLLHQALKVVSDTVAGGGRVLFVGTKRQAADMIAEAAKKSGQYYVNHRWLGGMLTNWKTISNSIKRLRKVDEILSSEAQGFTKKERLNLDREREKLNRALGGGTHADDGVPEHLPAVHDHPGRRRNVHPGGPGVAGRGLQHHLPHRAGRDPLQVPEDEPVAPLGGSRQPSRPRGL